MTFIIIIAVFLAILGILKEEIPIIFNLMIFLLVCLFLMIVSGIFRIIYEFIKPLFI